MDDTLRDFVSANGRPDYSAVFGAHAKAVTEHVMELVQRAAADRSGRSRATQRIRGRTIHIERVPRTGLLVYALSP